MSDLFGSVSYDYNGSYLCHFLHLKKYKTERKFILHLEQLLSFAFGIAKVRFDHDTGRIVSCNNTDKLWSGTKSVVWLHIVPELLKVVT